MALGEIVRSPVILLAIAFAFLRRPFVWLSADFLLRTYLVAPTGVFVLVFGLGAAGGGLYSLVSGIVAIRKWKRGLRPRPKPASTHWAVLGFFVGVYIGAAACAAFAIWDGMKSPGGLVVHGKLRVLTARDQLRFTLREMEHQGIWNLAWGLKQP